MIHIYWKQSFFNYSSCPFESCWLDLNFSSHWHLNKNKLHVPLWWLWLISVMHIAQHIKIWELLLSSNTTFKLGFIVTITESFQGWLHNNFVSIWLTGASCLLVYNMSAFLLLHFRCKKISAKLFWLVNDCGATRLNWNNKTGSVSSQSDLTVLFWSFF